MMSYKPGILSALCVLLLNVTTLCGENLQQADTAYINSLTREAYINARINPDRSISECHRALSLSSDYPAGKADASLALGMAYLAKYNPGDSAGFYNHRALELYEDLGSNIGIARACFGLTYVYSFKGDYSESEKYGRMSLTYFEKSGDERGMVNALGTLIYLARQTKDNEKAIELSSRAVKTAGNIRDTSLLADAINTRGNIFTDMLLINEAIDSYFEALKLWELKKDTAGMAIAYGSIARMYQFQEDYRRSLDFYFRKLPISENGGDLWEVSKTLNNISQIYTILHKHDSSLFYLRKGIQVSRKMGILKTEAGVYSRMASAFLNIQNIDSALSYANKAITISENINDPALPSYLVVKGHILKRMGKFDVALKQAKKAYELSHTNNDPLLKADIYALLSDLYHHTGQSDLAYKYLIEFHNLNDSLRNNDYLRNITRLEIQNEYDRKRREDEYRQKEELIIREDRIRRQNMLVRGLLVLLLLVAIISLLYIRHNRLRANYSRIDLEQRLLRAQMNPHFIFNSLCAVQDFILANKPKKANAFLVKIASLMRNILENSREEFISLDKEIETLTLYLDVQQLRFEREFEYEFRLDNSIDPSNLSVPPMLAQPCLENSIEHGLLPGKSSGRIEVSYTLQNDLLMMEVTDNGIGRKESLKESSQPVKKRSLSTILTRKRLGNFRDTMKKKNISYEIFDLYEDSKAVGTKVIMIMPCKKIFA